jgi:adenylate cyclase
MGKDVELAILFADVVGSTRIYEIMGDLKAREMVGTCVEIMQQATDHYGGSVIKTIGDEILATFPTADDAVNAAVEMHQELASRDDLVVEGQHVSIRVGCHFGPVVRENRDIFGAAVHMANRLTSQAKSGQIMISGAVVESLDGPWRATVRQIDVATLKGKLSEDELYEVLWQNEEATSMVPALELGGGARNRQQRRVRLKFQGREFLLDDRRNHVSIGRAEENDIVIKGTLISRLHARIELARSKILLIDESTNGTFVTPRSGEEAFVRRDSVQLSGEGMIGLGRAPESGSAQTLRYVCDD